MVKCPNCGQETDGDYCQWCHYPILSSGLMRRRNAEKQAKREAEEVSKTKEVEERARKEVERLAKEQAKREAEETKKAKEAEERARKEVERLAKEQAKREAEEARKAKEAVQDVDSEIYKGEVEVVVPASVGFNQVRQFKEYLEQVENLRVLWSGGSVDEGSIIAVSVQKPMTLIRTLNEMPTLEKVDKKGEKIVVMLKTPTVN